VGCAVGASMQGAILPGTDSRPVAKSQRLRLSELKRKRQ